MPTAPLKPCRHPGCGALSATGYCPAHKPASAPSVRQQTDPRYVLAKKIRDSTAWQKARRFFVAQNPVCIDPFKWHGMQYPALTQHAHHILPLIDRPDLAFDGANLAPLCAPCHASVEAMERKVR